MVGFQGGYALLVEISDYRIVEATEEMPRVLFEEVVVYLYIKKERETEKIVYADHHETYRVKNRPTW